MIPRPRLSTVGVSMAALLTVTAHAAVAQTAEQSPAAAMKTEMKEADASMDRVLKELQTLGVKPVATLSVEAARAQPTPADAVKAVLKAQGKDSMALMAAMEVAKKDLTYPTAGG